MNALEVVQQLVRRQRLEGETLTLVSHDASSNWHRRHRTAEDRISHPLSGRDLVDLQMDDLDGLRSERDHVVSISSRLAADRHLALMDLCPGEFIPLSRLEAAVREICDERGDTWLLHSGRHHHIYGDFLLDETGWRDWNVRFQLPPGLADPSYIVFSLVWGGNLLRLTAGRLNYTTVPADVIERPAPISGEIATRARQLAERRHDRQRRKSGEPMLNHLHEVADLAVEIHDECPDIQGLLSGRASREELYACGYLHDAIEDTNTDYEDVERAAGSRVAGWVALLSQDKRLQRPGRDEQYDEQIKNAELAPRVVKLADLLSNLRGLPGLLGREEPDWIERYLDVTERQLGLIGEGLDRCPLMDEARKHIRDWRQPAASAT